MTMKESIILKSGDIVSLESWQQKRGLIGSRISKNFSLEGDGKLKSPSGIFLMSETLIDLLQAFRENLGKPVVINSGFRTQQDQNELIKNNSGAAKVSPHVHGMAVDIDTTSFEQSKQYAALLRKTAAQKGIKIRIGLMQYIKLGSTFVHVDVCPEYFGHKKPYSGGIFPKEWKTERSW